MELVSLVALGSVPVALAVLTALGQRRRGGPLVLVVLAGMLFPVAWSAWYARDVMRLGPRPRRGRYDVPAPG